MQMFLKKSILKPNLSVMIYQLNSEKFLTSSNKLMNYLNRTELITLKYRILKFWKTALHGYHAAELSCANLQLSLKKLQHSSSETPSHY